MPAIYSARQLRPDLADALSLSSETPAPALLTAPLITTERFPVSDPQRYAIILARAGELSAKIKAHLDEVGWPQPTAADWSALREGCYVCRSPRDRRYHDLMPRGLTLAAAIMRDFARKFGVHHVTYQPGSTMSGHKATCTCGFIAVEDANRAGYFAVRRHGGAHMQQAIAGTLPAAYRTGGNL